MQRFWNMICQGIKIEHMKRLLALFAILSVAMISCTKTTNDCSLIAAKIIRYDCDRVIFQLMTDDIIGDSNWTDVETGISYTNVVSYYNTCQVASLTNGEKSALYVQPQITSENLVAPDCAQCQALPKNPPQTKVVFTKIQKQACDSLQ